LDHLFSAPPCLLRASKIRITFDARVCVRCGVVCIFIVCWVDSTLDVQKWVLINVSKFHSFSFFPVSSPLLTPHQLIESSSSLTPHNCLLLLFLLLHKKLLPVQLPIFLLLLGFFSFFFFDFYRCSWKIYKL